MSNERSAEWLRGAIAVCDDIGQRIAAAIYRKALAEAEAREAGDRISEPLLDRLRQDLTAIRYHLGGVGPEIKLSLDDRSRQANIMVAIHALDALLPLLTVPREATQPTAADGPLSLPELQIKHAELAVELFTAGSRLEKAAQVIEACEKALEGALQLDPHCDHSDMHREGTLWTVCNYCRKRWADDEGGFKPDPPNKHIVKVEATLAICARWKEANGGK